MPLPKFVQPSKIFVDRFLTINNHLLQAAIIIPRSLTLIVASASPTGHTFLGSLRARRRNSIFHLLRFTKSEGTCASSEQTCWTSYHRCYEPFESTDWTSIHLQDSLPEVSSLESPVSYTNYFQWTLPNRIGLLMLFMLPEINNTVLSGTIPIMLYQQHLEEDHS